MTHMLNCNVCVLVREVLEHGITLIMQGWQVSANSGLNRGLNRFKPSRQKQVFDGFYQTWYNNCSSKINNLG